MLDVGCGPGHRPAYVPEDTELIGIDPFEPEDPDFYYLKAICEYLPFKDGTFDAVVFGTSFDHVLDVAADYNRLRRLRRT